jgi:hypothetical protein
MQPQLWTLNGLSVELGLDRRTLAKRLHGLQPVKVDGDSRKYLLRDVLEQLQYAGVDESIPENEMDAQIDRFSVAFSDIVFRRLVVILMQSKTRPDQIYKALLSMEQEIGRLLDQFYGDHSLPEKSELHRLIAYGGQHRKFLKWLSREKDAPRDTISQDSSRAAKAAEDIKGEEDSELEELS